MFKEGEYVFLLDDKDGRHWLRLSEGMMKVSSLGSIDGSKIMKMDDGQMFQIAGRTFTVFRPGTADLMNSVERGAQIITPKDAATILMNCDIRSGDNVLEVGAGSGALTTALLRAVAPTGKVHTIEFRKEYAERAGRNVRRTPASERWSHQIGDARTAEADMIADAMVMDMPDPWLAFENLFKNLRPGGRICAYVPNTSQVQHSVEALKKMDFADITVLENIQREMEVQEFGVRPSFGTLGHTGYMVFGRKRVVSNQIS